MKLQDARGWTSLLVVVLALALGACGASAQVTAARTAHYDAPLEVVYQGVIAGIESQLEIQGRDDAAGMVRTDARWYEASGNTEDRTADDQAMIKGGSILLAFDVMVKGGEGNWSIAVVPVALQVVQGSPQPRELAPDDPAMPGWVEGKADNLYIAIHAQLAKYDVNARPAAK